MGNDTGYKERLRALASKSPDFSISIAGIELEMDFETETLKARPNPGDEPVPTDTQVCISVAFGDYANCVSEALEFENEAIQSVAVLLCADDFEERLKQCTSGS